VQHRRAIGEAIGVDWTTAACEGPVRGSGKGYGAPVAQGFEVRAVQQRLAADNGGYEIVHRSPGLEVGVYVLVAPEPDRQQPHEDDEIYVVLEGNGSLEVDGESLPVAEGTALFVEAGADHRFTSYESLSVLVIFAKPD
jgi:mannose-6-phosphate isomerase-like protein (cupin superfamily)